MKDQWHVIHALDHRAPLAVPKNECVSLHAWETGSQAKAAIGKWIAFCHHRRPHTAYGGTPPAEVYFDTIETEQQAQAVA